MKKVLFVINTLGGAGAEKALIELLKHFPKEQYEVSLYVLLDQGELISQIPEHVEVLNREYSDASVLSKEGKKVLNRKIWKRLWIRGAVLRNLPFLLRNTFVMLKKGKLSPDKLLWRVMSDSGQSIKEHYDMAVAYLEGGATYYVHDHINADRKFTFLHVDYGFAGCCEGGRLPGETQCDEYHQPGGRIASPDDVYWPKKRAQFDDAAHAKATMLRTKDYKYISRIQGEDELYDLNCDPHETTNRIHDPALASVKTELQYDLMKWLQKTADIVPREYDQRMTPDMLWGIVRTSCPAGYEEDVKKKLHQGMSIGAAFAYCASLRHAK